MEETLSSDIKLFPKAKPAHFKEKQQPFFTNFYQVLFKDTFKSIYQFSLVVQPQIPADSLEQIRRTTQQAYFQLKNKIQLFSYRGFMLWGFKPLNGKTIEEKIKLKIKQKELQYTIFIKQTKTLNFVEMQQYPRQANKYLQILNIKVQNQVRKLGYVDLGKGVYALKKTLNKHRMENFGVNVCQGFKFTLIPIDKEIYMKIDLHTRLFQIRSVLDIINEQLKDKKKNKQELSQYLQGSIVATNYGNFNTYKILGVQYNLTPKDKFEHAGKNISYVEYYLQKYAVKIHNLGQPLLLAESNSGKGQKEPVYVIPQIVSLTGVPDENIKTNFNFTKRIAQITKLNPQQRMKKIEDFLDDISEKQQILKIEDYLESKGHVLQQPEVKVGRNNTLQSYEGKIKLRDGPVKDPATFDNWVIVYSLSQYPDEDIQLADKIVQNFQRASKSYGIKVQKPSAYLQIKGRNVEIWKQKMQADIEKYGKPQIIVIVANQHQQRYYAQFKKWLLLEKDIPSQIVTKKKMQKGLSVASNVLLQMNVKIGKPIWQINRKHCMMGDGKQDFVCAGIAIAKNVNKKTFTLALVGSLTSKSNEFTSVYESKIANKSEISPQDYIKVFEEWLTNCFIKSKKLPASVIIYRQSLTDPQIQGQIPIQIQSLQKAYINICKKQKKSLKQPKIIYVVVSKTIDTRFFTISKGQLQNPKSGTIIPQQPDGRNRYSFYLVPHNVTEGTCTPTNFRVVYDDSQIPGEILMKFTFEECFNYFNWQGAVRVPAVLQYAQKLSSFVAKYIGENLKRKELCNSLYYI